MGNIYTYIYNKFHPRSEYVLTFHKDYSDTVMYLLDTHHITLIDTFNISDTSISLVVFSSINLLSSHIFPDSVKIRYPIRARSQ